MRHGEGLEDSRSGRLVSRDEPGRRRRGAPPDRRRSTTLPGPGRRAARMLRLRGACLRAHGQPPPPAGAVSLTRAERDVVGGGVSVEFVAGARGHGGSARMAEPESPSGGMRGEGDPGPPGGVDGAHGGAEWPGRAGETRGSDRVRSGGAGGAAVPEAGGAASGDAAVCEPPAAGLDSRPVDEVWVPGVRPGRLHRTWNPGADVTPPLASDCSNRQPFLFEPAASPPCFQSRLLRDLVSPNPKETHVRFREELNVLEKDGCPIPGSKIAAGRMPRLKIR